MAEAPVPPVAEVPDSDTMGRLQGHDRTLLTKYWMMTTSSVYKRLVFLASVTKRWSLVVCSALGPSSQAQICFAGLF